MNLTLLERLRACAEDPMWADHAEVHKSLLAMAVAEIERLQAGPAPTCGTVARSPFVHLIAHRIRSGHEDTVHYLAADAVQWVEQGNDGRVFVRMDSGDELSTKAEAVTLCAHIEAALTQRMTWAGRDA